MEKAGDCGAHALIIEDNRIVSRAIEEQLLLAGFRSVDHAHTSRHALELARQHFPDLVIVGEHVDPWAGLDAARELSLAGGAAVMMVSANPSCRRSDLPHDAVLEGAYRIDELDRALDAARKATAALCN